MWHSLYFYLTMCIVGLMEIFILSQLYVSISTLPWQLRIFSYLSKFSCFMAPGPGFKNITKLMWICVIVGVMGCRNNGLSEKWAVGVMGCRRNGLSNNDLTPRFQHVSYYYNSTNIINNRVVNTQVHFDL